MSGADVRAGFTLDLGRCVACGACVLACRMENGLPDGVSWRRLLTLNEARRAGGPTYHLSVACHHCEEPACLAACPSGAYEQLADGTVHLRTERCVGCRYCEMACPFGAPAYDRVSGVMTKCHYCLPRRGSGGVPACIEACPTDALRPIEEGPLPHGHPGFADRAGCAPMLRLGGPGGAIRVARLELLRERLGEAAAPGESGERS